ncbi:MAG: sensor histidine kinase, partial [Blastocatellia bacterium]
ISGNSKTGLWFATAHGLFFYRDNKLTNILDGFGARAVVAGGEAGQTWCATAGGGLYQLGGGDPAAPAYSRVDAENGLPSDNAFSLLVTDSERGYQTVWVGTNRGLAHYSTSAVAPGLRIIRILGKRPYQPDEIRQPLRIDYPQNGLLLEVEGMSTRTFPEQFQYSFELIDGSGKAIKEHVSREAHFVADNLPPGRYRIKAVAYSNDLVPSEPLIFAFSVASAPFPRTSAALSVLLLLALVALFWGYIQNRRLISTNVELEDTNKLLAQTRLQLANETENERRRIARDLHDQTLTDLRRLMLLTDEIAGTGSNGNSMSLRNEIEAVSTEIRHICEDLSPSVLANVGLTAALEWALTDAVAHLPADRRFEYEFNCPDDTEDRLTLDGSTRIHVYRIVQEAISNTCRHAAAKKVVLSVEVDRDGVLVVTLKDDGCGFDAADKSQRRGRGLNNIESRASLIEAEANWASR